MGHDTLSAQWAGGVRDGYPAGVPCWIDTTQPDPQAAAEFYRGLLGWELEDMMPPNSPGQYFVARLHGRDVAAISSIAGSNSTRAKWNTYVWVDDTDETAQRVEQARGRVLAAPFEVPGAGRMAECEDPFGARFRIWQAREHRGAQLVNAPGSWNWSNLNTRDAEGAVRFYTVVFAWEFSEVDFGAGASWMVRMPGYADFLEMRNPGIRDRHAAAGAPPGFTDAVGWLQPIPFRRGGALECDTFGSRRRFGRHAHRGVGRHRRQRSDRCSVFASCSDHRPAGSIVDAQSVQDA